MVLTMFLVFVKNHVQYASQSDIDFCVGFPHFRVPEFVFFYELLFDVEVRECLFDKSARSSLITGMDAGCFSQVL
jgi:hypothetical protein